MERTSRLQEHSPDIIQSGHTGAVNHHVVSLIEGRGAFQQHAIGNGAFHADRRVKSHRTSRNSGESRHNTNEGLIAGIGG